MYLYMNISKDHIHSTVFQEYQIFFEIIRRPSTDMNLLKSVISWSHVVGEVISCTIRKNNRSIIYNYEPDFSSQSTD